MSQWAVGPRRGVTRRNPFRQLETHSTTRRTLSLTDSSISLRGCQCAPTCRNRSRRARCPTPTRPKILRVVYVPRAIQGVSERSEGRGQGSGLGKSPAGGTICRTHFCEWIRRCGSFVSVVCSEEGEGVLPLFPWYPCSRLQRVNEAGLFRRVTVNSEIWRRVGCDVIHFVDSARGAAAFRCVRAVSQM